MGLLLQTYDNDRSGDLDTREITNLITDREIRNGRDIPTVPNEAEISWILQSAGKHRENAIDVTELDFALKLWDEYVRNRAKFEKMFSIKIESSHSQRLEFDQLKLFLTKLTGYPLKNSDVRAILHEINGGADGINLMQLTSSEPLWSAHARDNKCSGCIVS